VESSEIDLSEFQEENRDDGNEGGDGNEGTGQDDAQPCNNTAEPASGNVGEIISPKRYYKIILCLNFYIDNSYVHINWFMMAQKLEQVWQIDKGKSL
jgi:hypothetical protein